MSNSTNTTFLAGAVVFVLLIAAAAGLISLGTGFGFLDTFSVLVGLRLAAVAFGK